jgi:hypothetical protein
MSWLKLERRSDSGGKLASSSGSIITRRSSVFHAGFLVQYRFQNTRLVLRIIGHNA